MAISEIEEIQEEEPTPNPTPRSLEIQQLEPIPEIPKPKSPSSSSWLCSGLRRFSLRSLGLVKSRPEKKVKELKKPDAPMGCVGFTREMCWSTYFSSGRRYAMEDFHTSLRGFMEMSCDDFGGCAAPCDTDASRQTVPIHYFGVFDGHRGDKASGFCANVLHYMVEDEWKKLASGEIEMDWRERWKIAFSKAFQRVDHAVKDKSLLRPRFPGSTATVVLISPCQIIASNCGDSRAILCRGDKVIPLTIDHKPNNKEEAKRIEKSGGMIIERKGLRVEGVLAMTRAIDTTYIERSDEDEFIVIASDGLWNVMSSEKVGKVVRKKFLECRSRLTTITSDPLSIPVGAVAAELVTKAVNKNNNDNITVIIVDLKPLITSSEW